MHIKPIIFCLILLNTLSLRTDAAQPLSAAQTARNFAERCEWGQAITSYNEALNATPNDAVSMARRGYAYARIGNYTQAFADFDAAIKFDTNCVDAYYGREELYKLLNSDLGEKDAQKALALIPSVPAEPHALLEHASLLYWVGKWQTAEEESAKVVELTAHHNNLSNLLCGADANDNLRNYKESAHQLDRALTLSPNCYDLYLLRARIHRFLNQYSQAIVQLDRYICYNKKNASAFEERADCYVQVGERARAAADYKQAIELWPHSEHALLYGGRNLQSLKQYDQAIANYSALIKLVPATSHIYERRVECYIELKDWENALRDTQQLILLHPKWRDGYVYQSWVHQDAGQFNAALADCNKIISLEPKKSIGYLARGSLLSYFKHHKDGIADLTYAIKCEPSDPINFCARGLAYLKDQKYQRAIADCNRSIKLAPKRPQPYLSRGIAHARLHSYSLAFQDFAQAIKIAPKYGDAYFQRSQLYKTLGKTNQYLADLQKAETLGHNTIETMK